MTVHECEASDGDLETENDIVLILVSILQRSDFGKHLSLSLCSLLYVWCTVQNETESHSAQCTTHTHTHTHTNMDLIKYAATPLNCLH